MGFSLTEFKRGRRTRRIIGIVLFWAGLVLLAVDLATDFPTPVAGQWAVIWLIPVAAGAILWLAAKRLPLEETIEVSKYCHGELKIADLTSELDVTLDTAERILAALVARGYASKEDRDGTRVWVFPDVKASIRQRRRAAGADS